MPECLELGHDPGAPRRGTGLVKLPASSKSRPNDWPPRLLQFGGAPRRESGRAEYSYSFGEDLT